MFQGKWRQTIIFSLLLAVLGLSVGVKAVVASETDISGTYNCMGTNPGSNSANGYRGTTTISKVGSTYLMGWTINGESFTGIGIRNGNILSVSWYASGKTGIVVYKILSTGNHGLSGQWASVGGNGQLGTETLTR